MLERMSNPFGVKNEAATGKSKAGAFHKEPRRSLELNCLHEIPPLIFLFLFGGGQEAGKRCWVDRLSESLKVPLSGSSPEFSSRDQTASQC